jgi:hypothetical protein
MQLALANISNFEFIYIDELIVALRSLISTVPISTPLEVIIIQPGRKAD